MAEWISACIKTQPKVGDALRDLTKKIREYEDAAKPSSYTGSRGGFWRAELAIFRPGWKHLAGIGIGCGIGGITFYLLRQSYEAGAWAELALTVTVPVFVLGVSVAMLARSMSESGRFAVEYLDESCRMKWFCCLTLLAVLAAFVGRFLCTIEWVSNVVTVGLCAAALGAAIDCLAMLAFVVRETIRCSVPNESIRVVSKYAARKLCYGHLKEVYIKLFQTQYGDYLEKWCVGRAIHPPSQYYVHYFRSNLHSGEGNNDCKIELDRCKSGHNVYKDYDLEGLTELDKYLKDNDAELYLSSPVYESEKGVLGILSSKNVRQKERLQIGVSKRGRKVVRLKKLVVVEEDEDFWDSQQSKLNEAVERAVDRADAIQLRAYLDAVNTPLSVLRDVRGHKVVRDAYGEYVQRGHGFLRLYLRALHEILVRSESEPKHRVEDAYKLLRVVRNSVWEETKKILRDIDYHTMELFTWLAPQMYKVIQDAGDEGKALRKMRAQFGGFYEFAGGWLEDSKRGEAKDIDKMRLVLHEGLTNWLLMVMKDIELLEQLCDAGQQIVFGCEGIKFDRRELVARHFVLAGHLIGLAKAGQVNATGIEKLFFERYSSDCSVSFDELVGFYHDNSLPLDTLDSYLNIFYSPTQVKVNMFTGSSHSSGFGMTGSNEINRAFIFLAAHALQSYGKEPDAIADMSGRITEEDINSVREVFGAELGHFLDKIRKWNKKCDELQDEAEAKEIAEAELNPEKVEEHKSKFWEGYSRSVPVLSLCLKNGNYRIDNKSLSEWRYVLPKMAVINWKYHLSGAEGDRYGRSLGRDMEKNLLSKIGEKGDVESEIEGGFSEMISEAAKWLEKEGCCCDNGIVIALSKRSPHSELYSDEDFVPSWREDVDVRSLGFDGFYKGFPIVWVRDREKEKKGEGTKKATETRPERVVAVDLRGWTGISVREDVVTEHKFGELDVRTWKKEEIQGAIDSGKLDEKDVDKAKRNCPVDVSFYWRFSSDELPRRRIFILKKEDVGEIRSTNPSTLLRT